MNEFLIKIGVTICAFLVPLYTSFLIIGGLVICDTIFKLMANHKNGIKYNEDKFDIFFYKSITYMLTLCITHAVSIYFAFDTTLIIKTMTSVIVIKELNSIDKSIETLIGFSTFKYFINKLNKFIKK